MRGGFFGDDNSVPEPALTSWAKEHTDEKHFASSVGPSQKSTVSWASNVGNNRCKRVRQRTQCRACRHLNYHQMHGGGVTYDQLLGEVMRQYTGNVASARDLDVY